MAIYSMYTFNELTKEILLASISQLCYDSDTQKFIQSASPTDPTDIVSKGYVDDQISSRSDNTLGSDMTSIMSTNQTNLQEFTIPANTFTNIGDRVIYSSNLNMTSLDTLEFLIGAGVVNTFTAGDLLSDSLGISNFQIIYQAGELNDAEVVWYVKVEFEEQTHIARGTLSNFDLTSDFSVKTVGSDNSFTGTMVSYDAIIQRVSGSS